VGEASASGTPVLARRLIRRLASSFHWMASTSTSPWSIRASERRSHVQPCSSGRSVAGAVPSTNSRRRCNAVRRTRRAAAYSPDSYHRRSCSIDGNSTTTAWGAGGPITLWDSRCSAADEIPAAISGDRLRCQAAVALSRGLVEHLDLGDHISGHLNRLGVGKLRRRARDLRVHGPERISSRPRVGGPTAVPPFS
jgi:hypothetical protein